MTEATIFAGTSGFSYDAWKGHFYPADMKSDAMLAYYAERLPTVEINNTFYRMPRASTLEAWRDATPENFRFAIKAPRRITHQSKLKSVDDSMSFLFKTADALGPKLGPILFQLPPYLRKDLEVLRTFLTLLPRNRAIAIEFRSRSWFSDDVLDLLQQHSVALCVVDWDEESKQGPLFASAPFGYFRLRREKYEDRDLKAWLARIHNQSWKEAYVFFKHEDEGAAAKRAIRLLELATS